MKDRKEMIEHIVKESMKKFDTTIPGDNYHWISDIEYILRGAVERTVTEMEDIADEKVSGG